MSRYLTEREAAAYLFVPVELLRRARQLAHVSPVAVCPPRYTRRELDRYAEEYGLQATYVIGGDRVTVVYDG